MHAEKLQKDAQLEARIESFEMAFKMQTEATDAFDITKESAGRPASSTATTDMGAQAARRPPPRRARRALRAGRSRRLGSSQRPRDAPAAASAGEIDRPAAALLKDLKQRGLLDSTRWSSGAANSAAPSRATATATTTPGRDHNGRGCLPWMAGGGVKGGTAYGATDEFGARAAENKVHVHDLHATILALLGFDHKKLTYRYNGRDFRLTDNFGNVVKDIIA